jgi:hypothetical protein
MTIIGHLDSINSVYLCDEKIFSGSLDKTIKIW